MRIILSFFLLILAACSNSPNTGEGHKSPAITVVDSNFAFIQAELKTDGNTKVIVGGNGRADGLFQIGSISKYVCTLAILSMENDGLLSLDDTIGVVLPGYQGMSKSTITIRHLLQNRSGLPDLVLEAIQQDAGLLDESIDALLAANRFAGGQEKFPAGSEFDYVIANWILLQAILEEIEGMSLNEVLETRVFTPAGLQDTTVFIGSVSGARSVASIPPGASVPDFVGCAGGVASTPADLLKMVRYAYQDAKLSESGRAALTQLASKEDWYAAGGRIRQEIISGQERNFAWLSGSNGAFKSNLIYDPVQDIGFAVVTNEDALDEITVFREDWFTQHFSE